MQKQQAAVCLGELEAQERAMTPGDWQWFGNTDNYSVYLATVKLGRVYVMDFARWGMSGAQPRFQIYADGGKPGSGTMRSLSALGKEENPLGPQFEVSYRRDFFGIGHPDPDGMVKMRNAAPTLIAVAKAALAWRDALNEADGGEVYEAACKTLVEVLKTVRA